jgi:GNAT superfamily N-acetyltransferase
LIKSLSIRFATSSDFEFLKKNCHISAEIVSRKISFDEFFIAEIKDNQVGFLQLEYLWSLVPYISLIYVLSEYQRQGIGKALLKFVENFLRSQHHELIYSSSQVNEPEPQAWHRHVGFEECGIISGINHGIGEIFFRKKLV